MSVLEINKLKKSFGDLEVLKEVNLSIKKNTIYGLIGKNGAGKTTMMKIILGFLKANDGEIKICNEKVVYGNTNTNKYIGFLPDVPEYYNYMTPKEYLKLCGEIAGLKKNRIDKKTNELLKLVGLENVDRKIKGFSRGMKQRLGIAQALLHDPKLLICDEPTSALDPIGRKEILDILNNIKSKTTIIFSTHILSDVEKICDTIGILNDGHIVLTGKFEDLKKKYNKNKARFILEDEKDIGKTEKFLNKQKIVFYKEGSSFTIEKEKNGNDINELIKSLLEEKIKITKFEIIDPTLEDLFMEVI